MSMRKRNPIEREKDDFYRTSRECVDGLMLAETINEPVWEPACGDGRISRVLALADIPVVSTDLIDRGFGLGGVDFLKCEELRAPIVITNPPYVGRLPEEFAEHALTLGAKLVCLLMRLSWLEGDGRRLRIFTDNPPDRVHVMSFRPTLWHGSDPMARDDGGAISYAWYVWDTHAITVPRGPRGQRGFLGYWMPRPPEPTGLGAAVLAQAEARDRLTAILGYLAGLPGGGPL